MKPRKLTFSEFAPVVSSKRAFESGMAVAVALVVILVLAIAGMVQS